MRTVGATSLVVNPGMLPLDGRGRELKIHRIVEGKYIRRSEGLVDRLFGTEAGLGSVVDRGVVNGSTVDRGVVTGSLNGLFESRDHEPSYRLPGLRRPNVLLCLPAIKRIHLRRGLIIMAHWTLKGLPSSSIPATGGMLGNPGMYGRRPVSGALFRQVFRLDVLTREIIVDGEGVKREGELLEGNSRQPAFFGSYKIVSSLFLRSVRKSSQSIPFHPSQYQGRS